MRLMYTIIKRSFDIVSAGCLLLLLMPILLPIAIALKFTGEGDIFYLQKRIGLKRKDFFIFKFATMLRNSPNIGTGLITLRGDPRVMPLGSFLRRTKINELPQLLNIVMGDMSVVGPRPLVPQAFSKYPENVQQQICNVTPGLTGIGSIIFRDEEALLSASKSPEDFYKSVIAPFKGELELWYLENRSLVVDAKIIFLTALALFYSNEDLVNTFFPNLPQWKSYLAAKSSELSRQQV